ncbi:stage II sporulation protein P [Desulfofarcimen acetoxidans]|nr:stage II sporulation protein P [Desulfofarcimen acetoxidans]
MIFIYPSSLGCRSRRRFKNGKGSRLIAYMLLFMMLSAGFGFTVRFCCPYMLGGMNRFSVWLTRNPLSLMSIAMPVLSGVGQVSVDESGKKNVFAVYLPGVDLRGPQYIMSLGLPLLSKVQAPENEPDVTLPVVADEEKTVQLSKDCLVAIYNTHTGETYALTDGVDRLEGQRGGVTKAAVTLKKVLEEKYGIRTAISDRINDEVYNNAYLESEKVARDLIARNPKLQLVLDIHRDSAKSREQTMVEIKGEKAARVMIVVGSDARSPFPGWEENRDFAQRVADRMNELYPGLSLGVRVKEGRYNQHLHSNSILLEIGSVDNTTDEALYSAGLVADVLAGMINKND